MNAGIFAMLAVGGGLALITGGLLFGAAAALASPFIALAYLHRRVAKRTRQFEEQFPDALTLIASSLSAGHTFLRAIQMMTEEAEPPLSEEFARVVYETRLGDPLVDALERMAQRLDVEDLAWVVQAIRIQQTVGGKLADLLFTLADFMRSREEIRREVKVLTAEGRMSAWVLGIMPVGLFFAIKTMSPGYLDPMMSGGGLVALIGAGLSVAIGIGMIMRMVKVDV